MAFLFILLTRAEVVELVDALRSGRSGSNPVGVRVPPSAPYLTYTTSRLGKVRNKIFHLPGLWNIVIIAPHNPFCPYYLDSIQEITYCSLLLAKQLV
jgi:hypothetical protein